MVITIIGVHRLILLLYQVMMKMLIVLLMWSLSAKESPGLAVCLSPSSCPDWSLFISEVAGGVESPFLCS